MSDNMDTRLSKAEWRLEALEASQQRQDDRMTALGERMETHHREVMAAITGLRDHQSKVKGAEEQKAKTLKVISVVLGIIGLAATLGWINTAQGAPLWLPAADAVQAPIPVQYHTRELP